jgi:endo-1,4-beta-xylanase
MPFLMTNYKSKIRRGGFTMTNFELFAKFFLFLLLAAPSALAQQPAERPAVEPEHPAPIALWPGGAPGSEAARDQKETVTARVFNDIQFIAVSNVHNPTITPYLPAPEKATGVAVVIAPGGAHRFLAVSHEGYFLAKWLAEQGVAAFVLKYRLENGSSPESGVKYARGKESLADAQRAIRLVRSRAAAWHIKPEAVGIMGFSAGGEVAALAAMKHNDSLPNQGDPIDGHSTKPAFQALIYPGGADAIKPDENAPSAFLVCAYDDRANISAGIAEAYLRLHKAGVNAELHIFSSGGHGFGLRPDAPRTPVSAWPTRFVEWLAERGFAAK